MRGEQLCWSAVQRRQVGAPRLPLTHVLLPLLMFGSIAWLVPRAAGAMCENT